MARWHTTISLYNRQSCYEHGVSREDADPSIRRSSVQRTLHWYLFHRFLSRGELVYVLSRLKRVWFYRYLTWYLFHCTHDWRPSVLYGSGHSWWKFRHLKQLCTCHLHRLVSDREGNWYLSFFSRQLREKACIIREWSWFLSCFSRPLRAISQ